MKAAIFNIRKLTAVFTAMVMLIAAIPASAASASADSLVFGDVDGNNAIDSADALFVMRLSIGLADLTNEIALRADINGDKSVDSLDALLLLQAAIGIIELTDITNNTSSEVDLTTVNVPNLDKVKRITELCNIERAKYGLDPLEIDITLCACATARAIESAELFEHLRPNGEDSWLTILDEYNYKYRSAGENLAGGYTTPEAAFNDWMESPGHRANILDPDYTKIGVGYAFIEDSQYGDYYDQIFAGIAERITNEQQAKKSLVDMINYARQAEGLPALKYDQNLDLAAEIRASELPEESKKPKSELEKIKNRGAEILDQCGIEWYTYSCPPFYGKQSASDLFNYCMKDYPNNLPTFLDPNKKGYTRIGIGYTFVDNDQNGHYWVIMLTDE